MPFLRFVERPTLQNPWLEFERLRQGLDELSRGLSSRPAASRANVFPALNVYELHDELVITAELPGFSADDLSISLEGDSLNLQGKRSPQHPGEKVSFHRRELEWGSFSRSIALPVKVDAEQMTARLSDGILTIRLHKAAEAKPRQINVVTV